MTGESPRQGPRLWLGERVLLAAEMRATLRPGANERERLATAKRLLDLAA